MNALKQQFLTEFSANYKTMTQAQFTTWVGNRIMTLVNALLTNIAVDPLDLIHEYTQVEKDALVALLGGGLDDVATLKERSYGYNKMHDKVEALKTAFLNS